MKYENLEKATELCNKIKNIELDINCFVSARRIIFKDGYQTSMYGINVNSENPVSNDFEEAVNIFRLKMIDIAKSNIEKLKSQLDEL